MTSARPTAAHGISLINADLGGVDASSLRVVGSIVDSVGESPARGDLVVDLRGDRVLPGLINAHDHLQLNVFPRLKYRDRYANVRAWIEDIAHRRFSAPELVAPEAIPLRARQVHGGLKNLISGVTTVAHHDPIHGTFLDDAFPTRVIGEIGWSHSLQIDGEAGVQRAWRETPATWPWVIHAAEGVDSDAAHEFARLEALGCIAANTLIVHGVAMDRAQQGRLVAACGGLIWCPSSNVHLFAATADVAHLAASDRVALGTDSRMTGERDLLSELSVASRLGGFDERRLESLVTAAAARLLRLDDRGALLPGALADLIVIPAGMPLHQTSRADIRLVLLNGELRIGDSHYVRLLTPARHSVEVELDGRLKLMERKLAMLLAELGILEPGLEMRQAAWRAA